VKGYELSSGQYVTVGDDELAALDPEASRTVDIEQFVDLAEIDPIFYDSAYYVAPDKATAKPYALLVRAMEESGKVAIARFVMRSKQYLCAVRPKDGVLVLSTMVYADEVNDPAEIGEIAGLDGIEVADRSWPWPASSSSRSPTTSSPSASRTPTATGSSSSSSARRPARTRSWPRPRPCRRQGRRPHGRARGERGRGQGGPQAPPHRARPRTRRRSGEEPAAKRAVQGPQGPQGGQGHQGREGRQAGQEVRLSLRAWPAGRRTTAEIDGRRLSLSNLDKVMYPATGTTKGEVIDYYVRVAPAMLPHIADRG
jgi:hypothetical protein